MSSSSHIRDVLNLEIVVELYLLFFSAEKIQIEISQSIKPTSHFYYDILPKQ